MAFSVGLEFGLCFFGSSNLGSVSLNFLTHNLHKSVNFSKLSSKFSFYSVYRRNVC